MLTRKFGLPACRPLCRACQAQPCCLRGRERLALGPAVKDVPKCPEGGQGRARREYRSRLRRPPGERWRPRDKAPALLTRNSQLRKVQSAAPALFSPPANERKWNASWGRGGGRWRVRCQGDRLKEALEAGRDPPGLMAHRRLAEALQVSRDLVVSGCGKDGVWPAEGDSCCPSSLACLRQVPLGKDAHGIYSLCFAPGGGQLAAGFGNGCVQLVDAARGLPGPSLFAGHRTRQAVTALKFHRAKPGLLLAAGADGTISIYDLISHYPLASWTETENEINAMDFCRDGSSFATAGKDRHIRLYDSHTNQLFHVMHAPDFMAGDEFTPLSGHSRRIFALRFHPTELHLFLTGGWDNSVKVWDKRVSKGARSVINGPHICGPGIDVKGDQVLTGSWVPRNALQLWDLRLSRLWQTLPFPCSPTQGEFLYSAQFCMEDVVLAGGSGTSGASAIHTGTGQVVGEILLPNKPVHVVASAPGGQAVAVAGAGGNLHLAQLH
ncbi:uncharacterized protein LOC117052641 [Lacerta agilis]|uniref:uncharacterized protein LOC117052641 n=1 Tax=Lacerta agilis TaxID=80427 RepID=UPI001419CA8E|nr:uncharacterized protein LOC117052641 [Lacerta agilis]